MHDNQIILDQKYIDEESAVLPVFTFNNHQESIMTGILVSYIMTQYAGTAGSEKPFNICVGGLLEYDDAGIGFDKTIVSDTLLQEYFAKTFVSRDARAVFADWLNKMHKKSRGAKFSLWNNQPLST